MLKSHLAFVFGGFSKDQGTLDSIEKVDFSQRTVSKLKVAMPLPLRRFASVKIASSKILLLGGVEKVNKESDQVFCFDFNENSCKCSIENLDTIEKPGVIEQPLLVDSIGQIHCLIENACGTNPPLRSTYSFLEYS